MHAPASSAPCANDATSIRHAKMRIGAHHIHYRSAGDPAAPAFVLLHGFPSSSHMYRDLMPLLAQRFHVIAPDYPGFGHSDAPAPEAFSYTFDALAQTVSRLLVQLGIDRYHLYMQDYGGPVGMRLATAMPERILGLVFQNANCYAEGISQAVADIFLPLWAGRDESGARRMLLADTTRFQYVTGARNPAGLNPDAWTQDQALLDRSGNSDIQLALFRDYQTNVELYDVWQQYFRTFQPKTLVTWGKNDPFFPAAGAEAFRRDLSHLEVHYFDTGHFALEEDAGPIAALINQYF